MCRLIKTLKQLEQYYLLYITTYSFKIVVRNAILTKDKKVNTVYKTQINKCIIWQV